MTSSMLLPQSIIILCNVSIYFTSSSRTLRVVYQHLTQSQVYTIIEHHHKSNTSSSCLHCPPTTQYHHLIITLIINITSIPLQSSSSSQHPVFKVFIMSTTFQKYINIIKLSSIISCHQLSIDCYSVNSAQSINIINLFQPP